MRELKAGILEAEVTARRDTEQEAEVDMHHVALVGEHDVAVVAILDLQDVRANCVPTKHV